MATYGNRGPLIAAAMVALLIGVVVGFALDPEGGGERSATPASPSSGAEPSRDLNGVPVGYARTEEGAAAAATSFNLLSGRDDLLDADALAKAMETFAAPSWVSDAAGEARRGYEYVAGTYGNEAEVTTSVLRYEVTEFSDTDATVKLWTLNVLSGPRRPNVEAAWGIVTIGLQWIDGDWRVDRIDSSPGPAPAEIPSGRPEISASSVVETFDEFQRAPIP